ncbi:MAG: DUF1501 domain-containing protein [Pirellulales bacterium]
MEFPRNYDRTDQLWQRLGRRCFLQQAGISLGTAALATLLNPSPAGADERVSAGGSASVGGHIPARAKRVIYLFMSGGPSQIELFDYKPQMTEWSNRELPDSVRQGQRLTTMTSTQTRLPIVPSCCGFRQAGQNGTWISDLLPNTAKVIDDLAIIRSVHTDAINHDPGVSLLMTGSQLPGRPSLGAWISYGLGSDNHDLPTFLVLHSRWSSKRDAQPLTDRAWGAGFLPTEHAGTSLRSDGDPMLYLANPPGYSSALRNDMVGALSELNRQQYDRTGDPQILARIAQYELAVRMQTSLPALADLSTEPAHVLESYGPDVLRPGSFAANCLLARRLAEQGVRFIQVVHRGWDQHGQLPSDLRLQCGDTDQATAALIADLKQRGLLDDTLVVWGGEFGRTIYCQGDLKPDDFGRDHHPRCFTMWMAGGGVRGGLVHGQTDDFSYNIVDSPVHIHDLNATILHQLGLSHEQLTYRFQGRDYRLTDVYGKVVSELIG